MFETRMRDLDVPVTPTFRIEPPRSGAGAAGIGDGDVPLHSAVTALTMPFNLTGMPALTLPCGRGHNGLPIGVQIAGRRGDDWPIGVQIAGRRGDDWRVLDVGARLEDLLNPTT